MFTPNVSLSNYSTMRLGGIADFLVDIRSREELAEAVQWAAEKQLPVIMIGSGSNIVWQDSGFRGLVMVNKILGYGDEQASESEHLLTIGSGEPWDSVVARSVAAGLTGIEALSLIPGTAGATPVQNVGAYGQDISQTLQKLEVFDIRSGEFSTLAANECGFGYRRSRFQADYRGKLFIVSLTLKLRDGNPLPPYYGAVQQYLAGTPDNQGITPQELREAVIAIRSRKLPDVATVANNGSFFANPVVPAQQLSKLLATNREMPNWPLPDGSAKIPAAWLIEQAGFKDYHDEATGMATWPHQPLVLVNEHAKNTSDLLAFKQKIVDAVESQFHITLMQEPELLP